MDIASKDDGNLEATRSHATAKPDPWFSLSATQTREVNQRPFPRCCSAPYYDGGNAKESRWHLKMKICAG